MTEPIYSTETGVDNDDAGVFHIRVVTTDGRRGYIADTPYVGTFFTPAPGSSKRWHSRAQATLAAAGFVGGWIAEATAEKIARPRRFS